jgi:hypothetical protein
VWIAKGNEETTNSRAVSLLKTRVLDQYERLAELQGEDGPTNIEKMIDEKLTEQINILFTRGNP